VWTLARICSTETENCILSCVEQPKQRDSDTRDEGKITDSWRVVGEEKKRMFLKTLGLCSQFLLLRIVNFIVVLFYGPLTLEDFSYFPLFRRENLSHGARTFSNFRNYKFHYIGRGLKPTKGHRCHISINVVPPIICNSVRQSSGTCGPHLTFNFTTRSASVWYIDNEINKPNFTFMLPCIVIDLFLNNQLDALIIQFYSVIKLYMFRASSLPIIRSFLM
jgi:hypothetical protein